MDLLIAATAKRYNLMLTSNDKNMDNTIFLLIIVLKGKAGYDYKKNSLT